jgi:hypothetical protein
MFRPVSTMIGHSVSLFWMLLKGEKCTRRSLSSAMYTLAGCGLFNALFALIPFVALCSGVLGNFAAGCERAASLTACTLQVETRSVALIHKLVAFPTAPLRFSCTAYPQDKTR